MYGFSVVSIRCRKTANDTQVFYAYTYATAGWLSLQSITLMTAPQIVTTALLDETRPPTGECSLPPSPPVNKESPGANGPAAIEIYFGRSLGFALSTLAIMVILLTGSIPLTTSKAITTDESDPKAPYAVPTLIVSTVFQGFCAFYAYTWYTFSGQGAFAIGVLGYSLVASIGLWCILFASSHGKISRTTGADKRTAGFPFSNQEAEKKHGKKWS